MKILIQEVPSKCEHFLMLLDVIFLTRISRFVARHTPYLADKVEPGVKFTYETTYVALVTNWIASNDPSRDHLSRARWIWNFEKTILTGKWAYVDAVDINITEVRKTLQHESETLFDRILAVVPGDSKNLYSAFRGITLEDDPTDPDCLYSNTVNATNLLPFQTAMWTELSTLLKKAPTSKLRTSIANTFMQSMQRLRDSFLSIFLPTSGVTPRPRQVAEAKYRADPNFPKLHRNLRIAIGMTFLGNFENKVHKGKESQSYHPLAPQLVMPIHFLLGVVRPVENSLLAEYNLPVKEYNSYIFVKAPTLSGTKESVGARQIYTGGDVNIAARGNPGVKQPTGFQRQMGICISKTHFPQYLKGE